MIPYRQSSQEKIFILVNFGHIDTFYVFMKFSSLFDKTFDKTFEKGRVTDETVARQVLSPSAYDA